MEKSYLQIRDSQRTAWFETDHMDNLTLVAALLNKTVSISPTPDIATVQQCAGSDLRPITKEEYDAGAKELTSAFRYGLIAEIDLSSDQCHFVYWGTFRDTVYRASGSVSNIANIYETAFDRSREKLDALSFIDGLRQYCTEKAISGLGAGMEHQEQMPHQQGITM